MDKAQFWCIRINNVWGQKDDWRHPIWDEGVCCQQHWHVSAQPQLQTLHAYWWEIQLLPHALSELWSACVPSKSLFLVTFSPNKWTNAPDSARCNRQHVQLEVADTREDRSWRPGWICYWILQGRRWDSRLFFCYFAIILFHLSLPKSLLYLHFRAQISQLLSKK